MAISRRDMVSGSRVRRSSTLRQAGRVFLRPDFGVAQIGARHRSGCRAVLAHAHARRRLRSAVHRAAHDSGRLRGYRQCRSAQPAASAQCLGGARAPGQPGGRAGAGAGGCVSGLCAQEQCGLYGGEGGDGGCQGARLTRGADAFAQCADATDEGSRLRRELPLCA